MAEKKQARRKWSRRTAIDAAIWGGAIGYTLMMGVGAFLAAGQGVSRGY
jgi:hypothetical protein